MTSSIKSDFPALLNFVVIAFGWAWGLLWIGATFSLQPPWIVKAIHDEKLSTQWSLPHAP